MQQTNYDLQFVEHKHAVESIRRACTEGSRITLIVGHPTDYPLDTFVPAALAANPTQPISTDQVNGHRPMAKDDREDAAQ